jgi:beta-glucanase (GH16 family)
MSGANTPLLNLIFGDDFNGNYLDPHWTALTRDGDQSNSEQQYYLPANVSLDGSSNLVIVTKSQPVTLPGYNDANPPTYAGANVTRNYTSGCIAWSSFSFTYGKVQASAKVPQGDYLWPAIWMLGANCEATTPLNPDNVGTCSWPSAGSEENDILEIREGAGGSVSPYNVNYFYPSGNMGGPTHAVASPDTTFHTYETQWSAGSLAWLLDGTSWQAFSTSVASTPMFLLLQTAIQPGGTPTFTQPDLIVDWVRVFHN